ncbi:MAG: 3-phosphoshikimate 1-carboxyvinyltransferase, partial [Planctomycetota bacterium]
FPVRVRGPLHGGSVRLTTEQSSQFATALVLLVDRVKGLRVNVSGSRSFSYVGLTAFVQRAFRDPFDVEPDFSSAAALMVAAATSGGDLFVEGLSISSPQPDARVVGHLNRAGARVTGEEGGIRIRGGRLAGIRADLASCPDLAPLLGAMGALADGTTVITGAPHLRFKESDRISATVALVRALGGEAEPEPDGFRVRGGLPLRAGPVSATGDHRVAMAAGVLALSVPGVTVAGAEAVRKSYPRFFEDLASLTE